MSKRPYSAESLQDAFEYHVIPEPNSGCWLWTGPIFKYRHGYGCFTARPFGLIQQRAHRIAWELYIGKIPEERHVLHTCDNVVCVNPEHLFLGTQADNMRDMAMKGRQAQGPNHPKFKHGGYIGVKQNPIYHT